MADRNELDPACTPASPEGVQSRERLALLFGEETVGLASHLDAADLNLSDAMTTAIAEGVRRLKELSTDPQAQRHLVEDMAPGTRLLLCLWVMDMELLDRIQHP